VKCVDSKERVVVNRRQTAQKDTCHGKDPDQLLNKTQIYLWHRYQVITEWVAIQNTIQYNTYTQGNGISDNDDVYLLTISICTTLTIQRTVKTQRILPPSFLTFLAVGKLKKV